MLQVYPYETHTVIVDTVVSSTGTLLVATPSSAGFVIAVLAVAVHSSAAAQVTFTTGSSAATGTAISPAWPLNGTVPLSLDFNPSGWFSPTTTGQSLTVNSSGAIAHIALTYAYVPVGVM